MRATRFVPDARESYLHGHDKDKKTLERIKLLITACARDPFTGIGKPEALRGDLSGYCSRRIDETNRLVYRASDAERVSSRAGFTTTVKLDCPSVNQKR